mmetsp:Transcript_59781/g.142286  ORF Transcript_59781/g.142286 Transcript_59781/m.142286 type:complete len:802 (-) Transcript_59781:282-2687(-)
MSLRQRLFGSEACCGAFYQPVPGDRESSQQTREVGQSRKVSVVTAGVWVACAAVLAATLTATLLPPAALPRPESQQTGPVLSEEATDAVLIQPLVQATTVPAVSKAETLFAELTVKEVRAVVAFASKHLGCDASSAADPEANLKQTCFLAGSEPVKLQLPAKATALAYLDGEGTEAPPRMAEIITVHPQKPAETAVAVYTIGPLDGKGGLAEGATAELKVEYHWDRRPVDWNDNMIFPAMLAVLKPMKDIIHSSFGHIFQMLEPFNEEKGFVWPLVSPAVTSTVGHRVSRVTFHWAPSVVHGEANFVHPVALSFSIVQVGPMEEWYGENVTYCAQKFTTVDDLLAAEKAGSLQRCHTDFASDLTWDVTFRGAPPKPKLATPPASLAITPGGTVKWGDWELLATVRPGTGLALHDVRFHGERILYELGVSEAQAHYSSRSAESQWYYSDKAFSLTNIGQNLVAGIDCPPDAVMLNGTSWQFYGPYHEIFADMSKVFAEQQACIFETEGSSTLWRHGEVGGRVDGKRKKMLTLRAVSTVGNYDYISEVSLFEDGSLKAANEFAGYPETVLAHPFVDPANTKPGTHDKSAPVDYGTRVHGDLVAPVHAHYIAWKVDLDIAGTANEFRATHAGTVFDKEPQMWRKRLTEETLSAEDPDQKFIAYAGTPGLWRVVNPKDPNPLTGEPRGYAIVIYNSPGVQELPDEHPYTIASAFAKRHLTVTKRKDSEPHVTHSLDHYATNSPLLSVDNFLADKESLLGEDLVCWVNLGKEHVTRSEDMPIVSNFAVSFGILPWNFLSHNIATGL